MSMIEQLEVLAGHKVAEAVHIHDYFQIIFDDAAILTILNPYRCEDSPGQPRDTKLLTETLLEQVLELDHKVLLEFSGGLRLSIDFSDEAFVGPEAMTLKRPGYPAVVWGIS